MTVTPIAYPPTDPRLAIELIMTEVIFAARDAKSAEDFGLTLRRARAALVQVLDAAERYTVARALLQFHDDYDGAPDAPGESGPSHVPYAVAEAVATYLISGKLASGQQWWDHHRASGRRVTVPALAWLRFELLEAAESFPAHRATFEAAARLLACGTCNGEGFYAVNTHGSGEDAVEVACETCHGRGCGDCRNEDRDELRPWGAR